MWRGGTAGADRLRPFYLFRTFTAASIDRAALHAAMETAVQLVDEVKGPAVARGTVLGVIDDTPFLAVEYVEGRTLDALLAARALGAVMPTEHGLLIAERLLTALESGAAVERYTGAKAGGDPGWAPYDADRRATQRFDTTVETLEDPMAEQRELWAGIG